MERSKLICCLVGWHSALGHMTVDSLRIQIDQDLNDAQLPCIGTETEDLQTLQDLLDETVMSVYGKHINRKQRRS